MKKQFLLLCFCLTFLTLGTGALEARHHSRSRVQVGCNVGVRDAYVAQRVVRPVVARPVVVANPYYAPACVHVVPGCAVTPVCAAPVYVEEVYVAPRPRPLSFGGFSFSFNLFR